MAIISHRICELTFTDLSELPLYLNVYIILVNSHWIGEIILYPPEVNGITLTAIESP